MMKLILAKRVRFLNHFSPLWYNLKIQCPFGFFIISFGKNTLYFIKIDDFELLFVMPCPFTGPKMFCAGPNFLSQPKNLTAFSASSKTFVSAQKPILLNANHLFAWHKMFLTDTICK